ncbi:hypothetical protein BU16DRAFT_586665 [Lophium mytilinum]|uniref:UBC core domain-containing protein n=1 Tax=Lophium mytilinum TaxID=390894 RepID=A0A6A6QA67_9PEZI|nr:hypothetical protein BU16DRAFT_586665 [Lophium mytilinum]
MPQQSKGSSPPPKGSASSSRRPATTKTFATFSDVAQAVKDWRCSSCSTRLFPAEGAVLTLSRKWMQQQEPLNSKITCAKCRKQSACLGNCSRSTTKVTTKQGYQVSSCCSAGKLFMLWTIMCGFDYMHVEDIRKLDKSARENVRYSTDGGVGYQGFSFQDYAMLGMTTQADVAADAGKSKAQISESQKDNITLRTFELIAVLLPSKSHGSSYDENPPAAVVSLLRASRVLDRIAELLRNDSLENASHRKHLYQSMLDILRLLGRHDSLTDKTIFLARRVKKDDITMLNLSFHGAKLASETTSSIADCLKKLEIQSTMMLRGAQNNPAVFNTPDSKQMLWLCRQISDLAVFLLGKEKASGVTRSRQKDREEDDLRVKEVDDNKMLSSHFFGIPAANMQNGAPGRMRKIMTELTTLKTGLPPGIFLLFGSSRIDVMKAIIVGPEDTPYELGLFEFDILLPSEYPNKPPMFFFRGAEGKLLVSPNLHADGEVCLSILNTFHGSPWNPRESTLLQVLVSIQAMLFCADPFSTNPGQTATAGTYTSRVWNYDIQYVTMRYAQHAWLSGRFNPLWSDVVNAHFRAHATQLLALVKKWLREGQPFVGHAPLPGMQRLDPSVHPAQMEGARQQVAAQLVQQVEVFRRAGGRVEGRGVVSAAAAAGRYYSGWGVQARAVEAVRNRGGRGGFAGGFRGGFRGGFGGN